MSYNVFTIPPFDKQLKRLAKKFPSLKAEFGKLIDELGNNPKLGASLNNSCYKIRLAISSKGKGKSGGARLITHVQIIDSSVFLLCIYDKSEKSDISDKEINYYLSCIL
ncbi:MAG: type II toxin-antitoxin system RelE/ParE family toxin [Bacteroidota bacterium]